MMTFRTVKNAIISILTSAAAGNYQVNGSQKQSKGSNENLGLPRATVYFQSGEFPKSAGNMQGDKEHIVTFKIELTVILQSECDLSVLTNPAATGPQLAAALAAMPDLSDQADAKLDEHYDNIYQVLMAANNYDMGLDIGTVKDRWIDNFQKDNPLPKGEYLILTGNCQLTCKMTEEVTGLTGTAGVSFDNTLNIKDDPNDNAGTSGTLGGT